MAVAESAVDRHVEAGVRARLRSIADWRGLNNPWMPNDEEEVQYSYINLQNNPERFTGYQASAVLQCTRDWALHCGFASSMLFQVRDHAHCFMLTSC